MSKPDFRQMASVVMNSFGYQEDPETAISDGFETMYNEFTKQIGDLKKRLEVLESNAISTRRFGPVHPDAEFDIAAAASRIVRSAAEAVIPPVDRTARCLTDGSPEDDEYREIDPATGQQRDHVVLTPEERAKGFVRPVRSSYVHIACDGATTMGLSIAETYARDPKFYSKTFCVHCKGYFPVDEFRWTGTSRLVGS
jgi:hypothetical protein